MVKWSSKTVLVTGGAGHIGSRVVKKLIEERGAQNVVVLDNLSAYEFDQLEVFEIKPLIREGAVHFVKGSVSNRNIVKNVVKKVDYVFHLAAYADVAATIRNPDLDFEVNVMGTYNILKESLNNGVKRVIFASSASIYGDQPSSGGEPVQFHEDMKPNPLSTYANSKLWGEMQAKLFYQLYGLETVSLRYFSVYGPYQIPKPGSHSWVVAIFAMRAYKGKPLIVYGDGTQVRDFTYIDDIAEATIRAAEMPCAGEAINVGTGKPTRIIELARKIQKLAHEYFRKDVEIRFKPRPKGDPMGGYASTEKMEKLLGWRPETTLDEGLHSYFNWLKKHIRVIPSWI